MLERTLIDKENNANHINITCRRRRKMTLKEQPIEPNNMNTTFNPFPKIKSGSNIPAIPSKIKNPNKTL